MSRLIHISHKGSLREFGYSVLSNTETRHKALKSAVRVFGSTEVQRKLRAVETLTKNTQPINSQRYRADIQWISKNFG